MADPFLESITSDAFYDEIGPITSWRGLRRFLARSKAVEKLRGAVAGGVVTEKAIREFVNRLARDFERGKQFPHELPLAALTVALEERRTPFVEEFLLDLARLNITEVSLCPIIARESLKRWSSLPRTKAKENLFTGTNRLSRSRPRAIQPIEASTRVVLVYNTLFFTKFPTIAPRHAGT
jgi:hypothetical protein